MRITTFLLCLLIAAYFIQGFNAPECKHVFVEVEEANVKIERPSFSASFVYPEQNSSWPSGLQEGKELICVRCFHVQKQVLDYGEPVKPALTWPPVNFTICCDSISRSSGSVFLNGGVLQVDTSGIHKIITHAY